MFSKLFAESGLSLDRLRAMLEVGASGSIVKAAQGDPVRQSQYSRQIKELEDFFRVKLMEREGKGMRLTANGRELARLSRFFLLGLSNFQRGCLAEDQTFRIGASPTFIRHFLAPVITTSLARTRNRYALEAAANDEIERRLHDLTLDFGIMTSVGLSRPLQTKSIGKSKLVLMVPRRLCSNKAAASKAFCEKSLPLALAENEFNPSAFPAFKDYELRLVCDSFLTARAALEEQTLATVLPDFLAPPKESFWQIPISGSPVLPFQLAWNPRLLRLNPLIARTRDFLAESLKT
jgi:DNA-binding transcriptional LysR family regulator